MESLLTCMYAILPIWPPIFLVLLSLLAYHVLYARTSLFKKRKNCIYSVLAAYLHSIGINRYQRTNKVGNKGVRWTHKSGLSLIIPKNAVPQRKYFDISMTVIETAVAASHDKNVMTPVAEFTSSGNFDNFVQIVFPMKNFERYTAAAFYRNTSKDAWTKIKLNQPHNDIYYISNNENITIFTKHFTQFVCTCEEKNITLSAYIFASLYEDDSQQEVQLDAFIVHQSIRPNDHYESLRKRRLAIPYGVIHDITRELTWEYIEANHLIEVKCVVQDSGWRLRGSNENENFVIKSHKLSNIVRCHTQDPNDLRMTFFYQISSQKKKEKLLAQFNFFVRRDGESEQVHSWTKKLVLSRLRALLTRRQEGEDIDVDMTLSRHSVKIFKDITDTRSRRSVGSHDQRKKRLLFSLPKSSAVSLENVKHIAPEDARKNKHLKDMAVVRGTEEEDKKKTETRLETASSSLRESATVTEIKEGVNQPLRPMKNQPSSLSFSAENPINDMVESEVPPAPAQPPPDSPVTETAAVSEIKEGVNQPLTLIESPSSTLPETAAVLEMKEGANQPLPPTESPSSSLSEAAVVREMKDGVNQPLPPMENRSSSLSVSAKNPIIDMVESEVPPAPAQPPPDSPVLVREKERKRNEIQDVDKPHQSQAHVPMTDRSCNETAAVSEIKEGVNQPLPLMERPSSTLPEAAVAAEIKDGVKQPLPSMESQSSSLSQEPTSNVSTQGIGHGESSNGSQRHRRSAIGAAGGGLGTLHVCLQYDTPGKQIRVDKLKVKGLMAKHGKQPDPYVKVRLSAGQEYEFKSDIKKGTCNPEFKKMLTYSVPDGGLDDGEIRFSVKCDKKTINDRLGEAKFPLKSLSNGLPLNLQLPLQQPETKKFLGSIWNRKSREKKH